MEGPNLLLTVSDYKDRARTVIDRQTFDFINGGAGNEDTLRSNRASLDKVRLAGRVLSGGEAPSLQTRFGPFNLNVPFAIAPSAYHQLVSTDGEVSTARVAERVGVPFVLSSMSTSPFTSLADTGAEIWFQLYKLKDQDLERSLVDEAITSGCKALVVTVDVPVFGTRLADIRNKFTVPSCISSKNKIRIQAMRQDGESISSFSESEFVDRYLNLEVGWDNIASLIQNIDVPVFLKGVLTSADVMRAKEIGAAGCIVSNHGGRQLDAHPASADALLRISAAGFESSFLGVDGGFESAVDIVRGHALGAGLVLLGRPILWALAAGGEASLERYLQGLKDETLRTMRLCGISRLEEAASVLF